MAFDLPERNPCPFCENLAGRKECAVVEALDTSIAFVNPRQYRPGATLVIPRRHAETLFDLQVSETADLARHVQRVAAAVAQAFVADGMNVFQNNGVAAGQSVPHYHVHILPRHKDDGYLTPSSDDIALTPIAERMRIAESITKHLVPGR